MQQQNHFMQNNKTVHGKHKKVLNIQQHCEVHTPFSGKQDAYITTSMYPLEETFT